MDFLAVDDDGHVRTLESLETQFDDGPFASKGMQTQVSIVHYTGLLA